MALLWRDQNRLRSKGVRVAVPDDDVARLMYYLDCVFTAIEYEDEDVSRYRDYDEYDSLSYQEQRMVWILASTLSPDEFDDKVFFHSDELSENGGNEFYDLSQVRHHLLAVQSILVAGQTRRVKQIMTYTMPSMQRNYYGPIQRLGFRFRPQPRQQTYVYVNPDSDICAIS